MVKSFDSLYSLQRALKHWWCYRSNSAGAMYCDLKWLKWLDDFLTLIRLQYIALCALCSPPNTTALIMRYILTNKQVITSFNILDSVAFCFSNYCRSQERRRADGQITWTKDTWSSGTDRHTHAHAFTELKQKQRWIHDKPWQRMACKL